MHQLAQDQVPGAWEQAPEMRVLNDSQGKGTARASWTVRAAAPEEENKYYFLIFENLDLLLSSLQSPRRELENTKIVIITQNEQKANVR